MMVTDIVKELVIYDHDDWLGSEFPDLKESIEKYNNNKRRVLFYPWGVFVTSYARRNLYSGILEFGKDYIYSDTDSIKCLNIAKHMKYIKNYNNWITDCINEVLKSYGLDPEQARPKNKKGKAKQIGVWDWETETDYYTRFKTLGAKRYMYEQSDGLHITIAGVSKAMGKEYIQSQKNPFDFFSDDMTIDREHSGKLTHTYLDEEQSGTLYDYNDQPMRYYERSSVHLEKSAYNMTLAEEFKDFLKGVERD